MATWPSSRFQLLLLLPLQAKEAITHLTQISTTTTIVNEAHENKTREYAKAYRTTTIMTRRAYLCARSGVVEEAQGDKARAGSARRGRAGAL